MGTSTTDPLGPADQVVNIIYGLIACISREISIRKQQMRGDGRLGRFELQCVTLTNPHLMRPQTSSTGSFDTAEQRQQSHAVQEGQMLSQATAETRAHGVRCSPPVAAAGSVQSQD